MTALILVDLQNDFMPGGTLPVFDRNYGLTIVGRTLIGLSCIQSLTRAIPQGFFIKVLTQRSTGVVRFFTVLKRTSTGLNKFLRRLYVNNIYIIGLATEYCVKCSVLDAMRLGFVTHVIEAGCGGIDSCAGDIQRALETMVSQRAEVVTSQEIVSSLPVSGDMS